MALTVTFDGAHTFEADYAQAGAWNGWAAVGFTRAQADMVAAYCAALAADHPDTEVPVWDEGRRAFRMDDAAYPDEAPEYVGADARGLYPIGSYAWTWTIVHP